MDIKQYVDRCLDVMAMCVEKQTDIDIIKTVQAKVKNAPLKKYSPNVIGCLKNSELLKDTNLAKEFQQFIPTLPFTGSKHKGNSVEDVGLVFMEKDVFEGLDFQIGFMYIDSHKLVTEHNHAGDEFYLILNGCGQWKYNGNDFYETVSAGNVVYNPPMAIHGAKSNHTPILSLYIVVE